MSCTSCSFGGGMEGYVDAPPVRQHEKGHCLYDAQGNFICVRDDGGPTTARGRPVGHAPTNIFRSK